MSEIVQLQSSLSRIFREALPISVSWENPQAVKHLHEINQQLNGVSLPPSRASIAQVVAAYRRSRKVVGPRDLKYVCYGVAMPMQDGWCVLGDDKLRDELLADVQNLSESRKRFRCFQALLSSYFAFARYDKQTPKAEHAGWEILRGWLWRQRTLFQWGNKTEKLQIPGWFTVLAKHEILLTDKPCDRYGEDMLRGDNSSLEEARQGLGIPRDSWVMEETILSQMRSAANLPDPQFKSHLDKLLNITNGQTSVAVSELLKRSAIAVLVSRYARCASKPEHPIMRDAAVFLIGNPWLKQTEWDACVRKSDGQPDTEARKMVNSWITKRLITDFFELLSVDGKAVQRRLNYWLKYESQIEGLWFVLGTNAWGKDAYDPRYKAVRDRSDASQWLEMSNVTNKDNNAFVMRIGDKLVIEFGLTGNACFFYSAEPMPFVLGKAISERRLKIHNQSGIGKKLPHQGSWEWSFDSIMRGGVKTWSIPNTSHPSSQVAQPIINQQNQVVPDLAPPTQPGGFDEAAFWSLMTRNKMVFQTEDHRSKGGALWVNIEKSRFPMVDQWLESMDFKYKLGRGWWRE